MTSTNADRLAAKAVQHHHIELREALAERVDALLHAVEHNDGQWEASRVAVLDFVDHELMPHAQAEEKIMYPAAATHTEGRSLVEAMIAEHALIRSLADKVRNSQSPVALAAEANALKVVFESHMAKEDERILPLLEHSEGVSLAELLAGMHELLGEVAPAPVA